MSVNVGGFDRLIRVLIGVALLWLAFFSGFEFMNSGLAIILAVVGAAIMFAVGASRFCPIYAIFGIRSCRS